MEEILFLLTYSIDNMDGNWFCEEHNLKISIKKNPQCEKVEIDYFDDLLNVNDHETTMIRTINDVTGINCHLGEFTVFYDGKNLLHLMAYFSRGKSYLFERL